MNIPCKDCIVFAMCKTLYSSDEPSVSFRTKLVDKCTLVEMFLYYNDNCDILLVDRIKKLHSTFNVGSQQYLEVPK